eukprot:CAMPEP_0182864046 /NCGR_PEP_ID=MMETSP0034_2-20130328/6967_1 /TAXON_ID=156128 /ORGANISM="Nephroselmis pyriformis, Strain CCMP717" /LENGTH=626 /DNA_ID=CAMNT_0024996293 /DNA_START=91 /DNA_END=1971 /DNA_ORIENTATION=-
MKTVAAMPAMAPANANRHKFRGHPSRLAPALKAGRAAAPAAGRAASRSLQIGVRAAITLGKAPPKTSDDDLSFNPEAVVGNAIEKIPGKPRMLVLGSGWGSISFVKNISAEVAAKYDIVLVSPRNYFLYTPLLPAVATGTVEERSVVEPVRNVLAGKGRYFEAACSQVMPDRKEIVACFPKDAGFPEACFKIPYDILVMSIGSVNNTFGTPGVEENSYGFKTIEDAKRLRARISECFERASLPQTTTAEARKLLSFVIVGGGPTGVEVAAEMYDMVNEDLCKLYPELSKLVTIKIIELQDHVLSAYDRAISRFTAENFNRTGVELILNTKVNAVEPEFVRVCRMMDGEEVCEEIDFGACVWATGIKMNPLTKQLCDALPEGTQTNFRGLVTDGYLRVQGSDGSIYAMGDGATIEQSLAIEGAEELFSKFDVNGDGKLQMSELRTLMAEASKKYPHLEEFSRIINGEDRFGVSSFIKGRVIKGSAKQPKVSADTELSAEDFDALLREIDGNLRGLPATAQVAGQQGKYLAKVVGEVQLEGAAGDLEGEGGETKVKRFQYFHKGAMAYVGKDNAVVDLPITVPPLVGAAAGVMWKGYETLGQVSFRNQCLVASDWIRAKVFGRDISRF